jgi:hypothetical protein
MDVSEHSKDIFIIDDGENFGYLPEFANLVHFIIAGYSKVYSPLSIPN